MSDEDQPQLGQAMLALANDRQRQFVIAAIEYPKKIGRWLHAARAAGYGTAKSTNKSLAAIGARLAADDRVAAALVEESRKRLRALAPSAVAALDRMIEDPKHKDHARAVAAVLDRSDPLTTTHRVEVEHQHRMEPWQVAEVRERIAELARRAGVLPAPIDAEFSVVEPEP